jgi:Zn-dependent peptidase ImmA (M78 family)
VAKFDIPYLSTEVIQKKAEQLRAMYLGDDFQLPIDVELLAEDMGLEIWPVENLTHQASIDAIMIHSLRVIMVDEDEFTDPARWGRLRFTLAHEIGHFVLHSQIFENISFKSIDEWVSFLRGLENYDRLEIQAHEFGGALVVPRSRLVLCIQQEKAKLLNLEGAELEQRLAVRLSRSFSVSPELINVRFDREGLKQIIHSGTE